jgi:protein arginine kinase
MTPGSHIAPLIAAKAELTDGGLPAEPVVLSSRIRLARNLRGHPFPGWAKPAQRAEVFDSCNVALRQISALDHGLHLSMAQLTPLEKQVLVERRMISRELADSDQGSGVSLSLGQQLSVMINEEDHLRVQSLRSGFNLRKAWVAIDALDSELEKLVDFAFLDDFGYLTACPTNLGTGLRASAMLHLPGLVMQEHMEKVVRMVGQLGMAVRGSFGEGSEASGSIFQISNQQTLGESESAIIDRIINILHAVIEQEHNARGVLMQNHAVRLYDKIGRAYGILLHAHLLTSGEAMNLLSLIRLGVDLGFFPDDQRARVDRLLMEVQPGHVQLSAACAAEADHRDPARAAHIRAQFASFPTPRHPAN